LACTHPSTAQSLRPKLVLRAQQDEQGDRTEEERRSRWLGC